MSKGLVLIIPSTTRWTTYWSAVSRSTFTIPNEGIHVPGSASPSPSGMSSSRIIFGTVMRVVGGGASNDVGRKFLYDGASANEEGGGLVVLATYQAALVDFFILKVVVVRINQVTGIHNF